jgi:autotransporter-associated beta strand protein
MSWRAELSSRIETRITVGSDNTSTAYSGAITGNGGLVKLGDDALTLTGASEYTGGTTVQAETVVVAGFDALPPGRSLTIGAGARVVLQADSDGSWAAPSADAVLRAASMNTCAQVVPEPSTALRLTIAALGVVAHVWRRQKGRRQRDCQRLGRRVPNQPRHAVEVGITAAQSVAGRHEQPLSRACCWRRAAAADTRPAVIGNTRMPKAGISSTTSRNRETASVDGIGPGVAAGVERYRSSASQIDQRPPRS